VQTSTYNRLPIADAYEMFFICSCSNAFHGH
jgi:hypothetical protein